MHRTERKTEQTKQPEQEQRQKQQSKSRDAAAEWAQTVQTILAGGNWEQLPSERIFSLHGAIGNSALTELFMMRDTGPELTERQLPRGECTSVPIEIASPGEPFLVSPQEGISAAPIGNTQPLTL